MNIGKFLPLAWLAGFLVLMVVAPRLAQVAAAPDIVSAAAASGYNTQVAYGTAVSWSLVIIAASAVFARGGAQPASPSPPQFRRGRLAPVELLVVFAVFALAYFPPVLVRNGPYMEDQGFITALFRMACGQQPFRDFEFLYGPLMLFPMWAWSQVFGVSMESYFGFLALQEGLQFALLMGVLQLFLPDRKHRYLVFLLLLPFLFDTLLGPNWSAMRRLAPVLALLLIAARPFDRRNALACAALLGLHGAYSHDYAAAGLLGVGAIYGVLLMGPSRRDALRTGAVVAAVTILVWGLAVTVMLQGDWRPYIGAVSRVVGAMSRGHASFAFYWTVNSVALFGVLTIACVALGSAYRRLRGDLGPGDLMLVGAVAYALVTLKSGLARADLWHMGAAFLALFFAFLLPAPAHAVRIERDHRRWALGLMTLASVTYLLGILPSGSFYAASYLRGLHDLATGRPRAGFDPRQLRGPSVESERSLAGSEILALGRYLAAPEQRSSPVLFYGAAWVLAPRVGVCSQDYKLDDLMYSEFEQPERRFLQQKPDTLVVMRRDDFERVYGFVDPDTVSAQPMTPVKALSRWMSTVHYDAAPVEVRLQNRARDGVTGSYVRTHYIATAEFGDHVVLKPRSAAGLQPREALARP